MLSTGSELRQRLGVMLTSALLPLQAAELTTVTQIT